MNAYELAKELDACFTRADWNVLEAATMLRQQADRIAELEKAVKDALEIGIAEGFIKAHKTSAEPVAWMIQYKDRHKFVFEKPLNSEHILACEPLYTTPQTKPLTEQEALEYLEAFSMDMGTSYEITADNAVQMLRAIEERHGIK